MYPHSYVGSLLGIGLALNLAACGHTTSPTPAVSPLPTANPPASPTAVPDPPAPSSNVEVPPEPQATPLLLEAGSPAGSFGTRGPALLRAQSPDGSWLAWCEAREDTNQDGAVAVRNDAQGALSGDRLETYFGVGGGLGHAIDALAATSADGRYVVVAQNEKLIALDTVNPREWDLTALGATLTGDTAPYRRHRSVALSQTAPLVSFFRVVNNQETVVVRNLDTGEETAYAPPAGNLWRVDFDESGKYLLAQVVDTDTNRNGSLDWPHPKSSGTWSEQTCAPPIATYSVPRFPGDTPTMFVARLGQDGWLRTPGLIRPMGDALLTRAEDGALTLLGATTTRILLNKQCDARVLHVDAERGVVLAACMASKDRHEVFLLGSGAAKKLRVKVASFEQDRWEPRSSKLIALYPGASTVIVDVEGGHVQPAKDGDRLLYATDAGALLQRRQNVLWFPLVGETTHVVGPLQPFGGVLRQGPMIAAAPFVINAETQNIIGKFTGQPLALATSGKVLLPAGGPGDWDQPPTGPLVWETPAPVGADAP